MKFSFIIPVYNGEKYIDKCLTSILNQTYKNFEVIIINDGSTDKSKEILEKYQKNNKFIKLYNTKNNGSSNAKNFGIEKAAGEYIIFVDIDDYIDLDMLSYLDEKILFYSDLDLIKYDYLQVDNKSNIKKQSNFIDSFDIYKGNESIINLIGSKKPFDLNCIYAFKTNFWRRNNFKFEINKYHEDFGLIPYIILLANKTLITNKILYYYVQSEGSITRNNDYKKQINRFKDLLFHFDNLHDKIKKDKSLSSNIKKILDSYIANAILLRYIKLNFKERQFFKKKLNKRKIVNMLLEDSLKRKLKKRYYKIIFNI